jgi:DNA polymerase-3 subunit beta
LYQGLSITSHLSNKNVNLPVLQNVLIKAEGGTIRFLSTNLEIAVGCTVRGKVDEPGEYTVPSKLFFDYVSLLPEETVEIESSASGLAVRCGNHKTRINGLPASEFPLVPSVEAKKSFRIPVERLSAALSQVIFAVATNESRPELTGVLMNFTKRDGLGALVLAATDSYRLSEATIGLDTAPDEDVKVIVPSKTLSELNRILSVFRDDVDSPSEVQMNLSDNQVAFLYGPVELISRLIEGNYPDYRQIVPRSFQTAAVLDRDDAAKAVKTASLFAKTGLYDVTLDFDPSGKKFLVKAGDTTRGENQAVSEADVSGAANRVTVNYRYLLDGLNATDDEHVLFEMIDAANACLLTPKGKKDFLYIVMPIKQ